jgi:hypothetical protein
MANSQQRTIDLSAAVAAMQRPLALVDDQERRDQFGRYLELAKVHLERAVIEILSEAARAVNDADANVRARVQYESGTAAWVVEPRADESDENAWLSIGGDPEKVTIRIPAELKDLIAQAATRCGLSVNSWYIRQLASAVSPVDDTQSAGRRPASPAVKSGRSLKGIVGR